MTRREGDWRSCNGKLLSGRACWYKGVVHKAGKWWCNKHVPVTPPELIPVKELAKIHKMVSYYERHGDLGKGVDFESLWTTTVPKLLKEVLQLRSLTSEELEKPK